MAKRRSAAVMDLRPLSLTCTFGQPDVQGQAHALAEITRPHAGLEQGRFVAPEALPSLMRTVYRAAARHAAARADGVTLSVPSSYTQVFMRFAELPLAGPVTARDMDELLDMAEEAPVPPGYRLLRAEPLAWQIDGVLLRHAPEGAMGRLLQGYFALTYGDDLLCRELSEAALAADLPMPRFEAMPCALEKADGRYRWQVVVRAAKAAAIVRAWRWISSVRPAPKALRVAVDIDAFGLI